MPNSNKSVRDLKNQVLRESGVADAGKFMELSLVHAEFWSFLNRLGWSKRTQEPEVCKDVDATAFLEEVEYERRLTEFRELSLNTA